MRERFGASRCCCDDTGAPCQCQTLDDFNFVLGAEYGRSPIDLSGCSAETLDQLIDDIHVQFILGGMPPATYDAQDSWCDKLNAIASEINQDKIPGTAFVDDLCCPIPLVSCPQCPNLFNLDEPYVDIRGYGFLNGAGAQPIFQWVLSKINGRHRLGPWNGINRHPIISTCRRSIRYIFDDQVPVINQEYVDIQVGMGVVLEQPHRMMVSVEWFVQPVETVTRSYSNGQTAFYQKTMVPSDDCLATNQLKLITDDITGTLQSAAIGDPNMPQQPLDPFGNPERWSMNVPGDATNPPSTPGYDSRPILDVWVSPI